MDDGLEQLLLDRFVPYIVQYNSDDCPGPNTNGTGDTNLVVSRIFPISQQYTNTNSIDSVKINPTPITAPSGLTVGLYWYSTVVKVNSALLYGRDCGLTSHTADVEGFNFSLKYTGTLPGGWMYDTDLQHWQGGSIQTVSHAGTFCEAVQTFPYRSATNATGKDTIYPSPDKHGNFLTVQQCSSNFICDPACSGASTRKKVKNVNIGEPNAPMVTNLGTLYAAYAGEDPWGNNDFLNGGAGTIKSKMELELNNSFFQGVQLSSQGVICNLYRNCYGPAGSAILAYTCAGTPYGFYSQQITTSGVYTEVLATPYGCDSTVTLTLSIEPVNNVTINAAICSNTTYPFDGQQLDSTGTYQATLINSVGCDSAVTLNLIVDGVINVTLNEGICAGDSYLFNGQSLSVAGVYADTSTALGGCDSVTKLNLTVNSTVYTSRNASICDGQTYFFQGQSLTSAGLYADTFIAITGCDSIVTLQLQVDTLPAKPMINAAAAELSTDSTATDYLWFLNGVVISGANSATYTAAVTGFYQVSVADAAGCLALSDSIFVNGVGIDVPLASGIKLYPNPSQGTFTIVTPDAHYPLALAVYSLSGKQVHAESITSASQLIDLPQLSKGLYFLRVSGEGFVWNGKLYLN